MLAGVRIVKLSGTIFAHNLRIQKAVATRTASRADVVAQFSGNVPTDIHI
jgi:hypothetical protein